MHTCHCAQLTAVLSQCERSCQRKCERLSRTSSAKEVADGDIHPGLHAMAVSKYEGDEVKANAMYLQLRVDVFKQEAAVGEKILEAAERNDKASLSKTGTDDWPVEVIIFVFLVVMAALLAMGFLKGYG